MKVVDIERVVILMRFIQHGWSEERKKAFDEDLRMMLGTQCEDLSEHDKQIRAEVIEEIKAKAHCEDTECWDCAFGDAEVGCLLKENK